ncbi:hypothetical protein [Paractinoplanes durhamensis]|uniref:DUF1330 domain-containing protein n=1 Tax=Paractinoplanes durhamensis TaxID=113563 RepID=A0ABQ3Z4X5_9ACTN|nr:hypothetical protein [Actinoplanes durhamensis]GIE04887.1 hypothetical protein Adu01nite_62370 [Actinoplanes durhamensis]
MLLVAIVEMVPGRSEEGRHYENEVLKLLARHGATVERRTRSTDGTAEVHLIRFQAREGFESFMADQDRATLREKAGPAAPTTRVIEVLDV